MLCSASYPTVNSRMLKKLIAVFLPLAIALPTVRALNAQGSGRAGAASIEGDVYLLNKLGEIKKGAAGTVALARPGAKLEEVYRAACQQQAAEKKAYLDEFKARPKPATTDPDVMLKAMDADIARVAKHENAKRDQLLTTLIEASLKAPTGMNAHYTFKRVPPGSYYLLSLMHLGDLSYAWIVPVTLKGGQALQSDLDNNNAQLISIAFDEHGHSPDKNPLFCGSDGLGREFPIR